MDEVVYCGHSAVLLISRNGYTIGIDPWLKGNPKCPQNLYNPERLDLIVLTHGHSDHAGDALRLASQYNSKIAATFELAMIMIREGISEAQVQPMNKGGSVDIDGIRVTLTHAFHSSSYDLKSGETVYAGEPCGVVISDGAHVIYHAGDTEIFSDMRLIGEIYKPKVGFLPIGDRFTMSPTVAAKAAKLLGLERAIPIHYNTFPLLEQSADAFVDALAAEDVEPLVMEPGQRVRLWD